MAKPKQRLSIAIPLFSKITLKIKVMKINIIYARVSTEDKQDTQRQIEELKKRVLINDDNTSCQLEIIEEKISGYKLQNGSKLENLISRIAKEPNKYEMLYIWEISRLGRNPLETRTRVEKLLESGIKIYVETLKTVLSNDYGGMSNAMTKMILLLLLEFSHIEAQTTKLRIKSGLLHSARSGKVGGSNNIPYGYKKGENKKLIICNDERKIIERIFNLYKEGFGIRRISTILNNDGVPTRYNKIHYQKYVKFKTGKILGKDIRWSDKQIHDIIRNTLYIGERRFKGEILDCPAIIDKEIFKFCENIRLNKNTKGDTKHIFLLKDLLKCKCGRNMVGINKSDEKVYKCSSRLRTNSSCGSKGINIKLIESTIFHQVLLSSQLINFLQGNKDLKKEILTEIQILKSEIINLKKKNLELAEAQLKLLDDTIKKSFPGNLIRKKSDLLNKEIMRNQMKIDSAEINIINKQKILDKKIETNYELIQNSKNDRGVLKKLYSEVVNSVQIVEFDSNFLLIDLTLKVFDKNKIILRLNLNLTNIRKKIKTYIYIVESARIFVNRFGKTIEMNFFREDYIDVSMTNPKKLKPEKYSFPSLDRSTPISIDNQIVSENDFIYEHDIDENDVFAILKHMFIERFKIHFVYPLELKEEQLIVI